MRLIDTLGIAETSSDRRVHADIERLYAGESARLVRERLGLVAGLFILLMGVGCVAESLAYPARTGVVFAFLGVETMALALAAIAARVPGIATPGIVGALLTGVLSTLITYYHVRVGAPPERAAMVLSALLNGLAVLVPWGPVVQAAGALLSLLGFARVALWLHAPAASWVMSCLAVGVAGVTSTVGAWLLERYRSEAFRRTTLHAEEAEVAATLVKVGEVLAAHLGAADMLERVNALAVETIGCDWSSIFLMDETRGVYRLASNAGSTPEVRALLAQMEFAPDSMPLLQRFRPGALMEVERPDGHDLAPEALLRRVENASALYAPIGRGDRIVGVLLNGYRTRTGPFTERQRRLTLGFAHAIAVALENVRLIATLQTASRLKSDFVATMSHELRTPLNVIMGYSEMLAEGVYASNTPEFQGTLARIQRASIELMDLISATLDMGRLEAGRETVTMGPVVLGRLFDEIASEMDPLVPTGVRFQCANALGEETVTTDGAKLKTIVKNLVGNALKFTTAGTVAVAAHGDGEMLVIAVRDTGVGIAPEYLPVIFEMFRQVDGSTTRRYGGVGLGLHIVKRLVTLLGGAIDVESTPGVGSTFTVTIPVTRANRQRAVG